MNTRRRGFWLGASVLAIGFATAQTAYAQDDGSVDEIVVTATRRSENVQDVPMNVTPISGEALREFNILRFEDVQTLTPGLSIGFDGQGGPVVQLRGVSFSTFTSSPPAVDLYLNEVPVDANHVFQTLFDVGQIEVLRGPQGTLRGRPAPVGAITITTRRPDMDEYGFYGSATASDLDARNLEAGVNIPLIKDVLSARLSGVYDERGGGIKNALTGAESGRTTKAWRGTLRWLPTDNIEIALTHQHLDSSGSSFTQLEGSSLSGPLIRAEERLGLQEFPTSTGQGHDFTWLNASWDVAGHRASYIGSYHKLENGGGFEDTDPGNGDLGTIPEPSFHTTTLHQSHEVRFETAGADRLLDYTVGAFYSDNDTLTVLPVQGFDLPIRVTEKAGFGNATLHLGRTDISAGLRYSEVKRVDDNLGCFFLGGFFPEFCGPGQTAANPSQERTTKGWVYNASVSHHVTDDLMVYGVYGRSRRPGVPSTSKLLLNPQTLQYTCPDLVCAAPVEVSDSYELGVKSTWRDGRVRLNAAAFHQDYENYIGRAQNVPNVDFFNLLSNAYPNYVTADDAFTAQGPAVVSGLEADLFVRVNENLDFQVTAQTADGHYDNALIPCRDGDFDGVPDDIVNTDIFAYPAEGFAACRVSSAISQVPNWSMTLQGEYRRPMWGGQGYVRTLMNYEPENANVRPGSFVRDARTIVNLYVGLRSDAGWDFTLWAKNLLDEDTVLDRDSSNLISPGGVNTGYRKVTTEAPREIGMSIRYAFGAG